MRLPAKVLLYLLMAIFVVSGAKADDAAVHGNAGHDWYAAQNMNPEVQARLGVGWKSCCENADVFRTKFQVDQTDNGDDWYYLLPNGTWKLIPRDAVKWGQFAPDGRPTLFIYQGIETCFYVGEDGG